MVRRDTRLIPGKQTSTSQPSSERKAISVICQLTMNLFTAGVCEERVAIGALGQRTAMNMSVTPPTTLTRPMKKSLSDDVVACGEIRGDMGRYGEIRGDTGRGAVPRGERVARGAR